MRLVLSCIVVDLQDQDLTPCCLSIFFTLPKDLGGRPSEWGAAAPAAPEGFPSAFGGTMPASAAIGARPLLLQLPCHSTQHGSARHQVREVNPLGPEDVLGYPKVALPLLKWQKTEPLRGISAAPGLNPLQEEFLHHLAYNKIRVLFFR